MVLNDVNEHLSSPSHPPTFSCSKYTFTCSGVTGKTPSCSFSEDLRCYCFWLGCGRVCHRFVPIEHKGQERGNLIHWRVMEVREGCREGQGVMVVGQSSLRGQRHSLKYDTVSLFTISTRFWSRLTSPKKIQIDLRHAFYANLLAASCQNRRQGHLWEQLQQPESGPCHLRLQLKSRVQYVNKKIFFSWGSSEMSLRIIQKFRWVIFFSTKTF